MSNYTVIIDRKTITDLTKFVDLLNKTTNTIVVLCSSTEEEFTEEELSADHRLKLQYIKVSEDSKTVLLHNGETACIIVSNIDDINEL